MSDTDRLPWQLVETFPSTDASLIAHWEAAVDAARDDAAKVRALVGLALVLYWAAALESVEGSWTDVARRRRATAAEALRLARRDATPDILATALLGSLYARWGPDHVDERGALIDELERVRDDVGDEELRLRILEWRVLRHLDTGDLDAARAAMNDFVDEAADTDNVLFHRRETLWEANIAMLVGAIDESLRTNQEVIASTASTAGAPFSFQNVAITVAIERFFRRGLADVVDVLRSIRASSPRVAPNWDTGLAFALAESGQLVEAGELFEGLAADGFAAVPRDLNWLVTIQLLALIALTLDDRDRIRRLLELLRPFARYDGTHGSGYASYGPLGRVVGSLAARVGAHDEAERWFAHVLETRHPGPWTSLTRLDRARSRRSLDPVGALHDAQQAHEELRSFDMHAWADDARALALELRVEGYGSPIARRSGGQWTFSHPSGRATVRDTLGARYLVELLARPGTPLDVTGLEPTTDRSRPVAAVAESTLDESARAAYRRRLADLDRVDSLTPAEADEQDFLRRELAGAVHVASSSREIERTRVRVTKAIRRSIESVAQQSAGLGDHLRSSVETGRHCLYQPADGVAWQIERDASPSASGG